MGSFVRFKAIVEEDPPLGEDEKTPFECVACRGQWRTSPRVDGSEYREVRCQFCTQGAMRESQWKKYMAYLARKNKRNAG